MSRKGKDASDAFGPIPEDALEFSVNPRSGNSNDPFMGSLDRMSERDIAPGKQKHDKPKQKASGGRIVRNVILTVSILVAIGCAIWLVDNLIDKKKSVDEIDEIRGLFYGVADEENGVGDEYDPGTGAIVRLHKAASATPVLCLTDRIAQNNDPSSVVSDKDFDSKRAGISVLKGQYPDVYGWIKVPDTHIDHPIMQSNNNDYYLNHSYKGTALVTGSIFADYTCSRTIMKNYNTVFYGHNITTGDMFHDVTKFLDEDFFYSKKIYVYTLDGVFVYEPFAIFEAKDDSGYIQTDFEGSDAFIEFAERMQSNSRFNRHIEFKASDRMITLSTCTNGAQTQRWCLQARLVQII